MLSINELEVYRYLGFKDDQVDNQTKQEINEAIDILNQTSMPKYTYKVFKINHLENQILIDQTDILFPGNNIKQLLKDSHDCIFLVVTLGQSVDQLLRKMQIQDLSKAIIYDACASSMIDRYCEQIHQEIGQNFEFLTDRFSPGYGDLPLSFQKNLCHLVEAKKYTGVHLSSNDIMIPRKSISGIIGIATKPQQMKIRGCQYCQLSKVCQIKKRGEHCG